MIPIQKTGRLRPKSDPDMMIWVSQLFGLTAAKSPAGIPRRMARIMAETASSRVAGARSKMSLTAGWLKVKALMSLKGVVNLVLGPERIVQAQMATHFVYLLLACVRGQEHLDGIAER
jgi:hypothetical protein